MDNANKPPMKLVAYFYSKYAVILFAIAFAKRGGTALPICWY